MRRGRAGPDYWGQPRCEVCDARVSLAEVQEAAERHDKIRCRKCLRLHRLVKEHEPNG